MVAALNSNRMQGLLALALVLIFAALGVWYGAPPDSANAGTFGAVLRAFAVEEQTRSIIAMIIVNVVTGVIGALRVGVFDTQRLADFMRSNVLPYLLGYMLFWFLAYFGMVDVLPPGVASAVASLGYGTVMAALTVSILDNLARANVGTIPPADAAATHSPPANPQA